MMGDETRARRSVTSMGEMSADRALRDFGRSCGEPAVGFVYRPDAALWFRLAADGTPTTADGEGLSLVGVFELRAFTADRELRWHNVSAGAGPAVMVTDDGPAGQPARFESYERLLWGTAAGGGDHPPGWVQLRDGRIGDLTVPVDGPVGVGDRVWLTAVEYTAEDEFGNVAVVDERLTGLTVRPDEIGEGAKQ